MEIKMTKRIITSKAEFLEMVRDTAIGELFFDGFQLAQFFGIVTPVEQNTDEYAMLADRGRTLMTGNRDMVLRDMTFRLNAYFDMMEDTLEPDNGEWICIKDEDVEQGCLTCKECNDYVCTTDYEPPCHQACTNCGTVHRCTWDEEDQEWQWFYFRMKAKEDKDDGTEN